MCTCVCVGGEEECCHVGDSAGEGHERGMRGAMEERRWLSSCRVITSIEFG
jgi:hypothetical protein